MSAKEVARRAWFTLQGLQSEIGDMTRMRNREAYRVARCGEFRKVVVLLQDENGRSECEMKYIGADHGQRFFYSDERKAFYSGPSLLKGKMISSDRYATVVTVLEEGHLEWKHLIRALVVSQKKTMLSK